jgi:abhydrolase domain-containing protein 1/3
MASAAGRQFWRDANYRRQALVTPDGGLIALDWYHGSDTLPHLPQSTPILMVFHGLTGVALWPLAFMGLIGRTLSWFHYQSTIAMLLSNTGLESLASLAAGGSREGYCKAVCAAALQKGWRAAVLNYRGCAGEPKELQSSQEGTTFKKVPVTERLHLQPINNVLPAI